jgi:nicotinate-nucleotide--dimethylbenzimidazole phosphoribosyltransferase
LDRVEILVFAGNHGVTKLGVSAYPAEVTAQMVANFASGGAAINQLARTAGATLRVIPLSLDEPTADFTEQPALTEQEFLAAVTAGYEAVAPDCDLICLGEMGIGNTTAAAAIAAAVFGGGGARWAGRGTGVDEDGLARKRAVIDRALDASCRLAARSAGAIAAALGGRELAAILGATLAARRQRIPVLLDGFVCTAAVAPLAKLRADTLAHAHGRPRLGRGRAPHAAEELGLHAARRSQHAARRSLRRRRGAAAAARGAGLPYRHGDLRRSRRLRQAGRRRGGAEGRGCRTARRTPYYSRARSHRRDSRCHSA